MRGRREMRIRHRREARIIDEFSDAEIFKGLDQLNELVVGFGGFHNDFEEEMEMD